MQAEVFGLSLSHIETIRSIFLQYPEIQQVKIFGSRALGTYKANSDIDFVLYTATQLNDRMLKRLTLDFMESALPFQVDLLIYSEITHAGLLEHIERCAQIFYCSVEK